MNKMTGVPINSVLPDSPAAKAGLKVGDQVIMMNGIRTKNWNDYAKAKGPGRGLTHTLEIVRNKTETLTIVMDCSTSEKNIDPGDTVLKFQAIGGLPQSVPSTDPNEHIDFESILSVPSDQGKTNFS